MRLDRAYGLAPIQEFIKEKVDNGYIYSVRFNVAWEIFGATIDVSSRIDNDQSALDEIRHDLEWELSSDFNTNNILFVTDYDAPKVSVKISDVKITNNELDEFERNIIATVRYNLGADFDGNGKLDFYDWYGEWLDVYSYTSAAPKAIDRLRDTIINTYDYAVLLDGLADLIDPTRHNFGGEDGTNGENYDFACSNCGYCGDIAEPKYCPNCGARVVNDD